MNTTNKKQALHPAWIVGFIDGEGTFSVSLLGNKTIALNYQVQLRFIITQHVRDIELIEDIHKFFGCGHLVKDTDTKIQYRITGIDNLEKYLFPLLDKYPLRTKKSLDADVFRKIYNMMKNKEHLTPQGLSEIRYLKSTINRGRVFNKDANLYLQIKIDPFL